MNETKKHGSVFLKYNYALTFVKHLATLSCILVDLSLPIRSMRRSGIVLSLSVVVTITAATFSFL